MPRLPAQAFIVRAWMDYYLAGIPLNRYTGVINAGCNGESEGFERADNKYVGASLTY